MSEQQFSRPGAVDLTGLQQAAQAGTGATGGGAYAVVVDEQILQSLLEASMNAPVVIAFVSPSRSPESVTLADDLKTLSDEFEGKFLLGRVDVDRLPQIAQAVQVPSVPYVVLVAQGRPMPLMQQAAPIEDLRAALTQVFQQLATGGITGRHQPRSSGGVDAETGE
ncbi:MAG TPA: thioredoxin domain-containing protein, partial [Marmoricola sp.]